MLDHISIPVRDFEAAATFYDAVLGAIGLTRTKEREGAIGYGDKQGYPPIFWILAHSDDATTASSGIGLHISFRVDSRDQVHAFHKTALESGGRDAGSPGPRPHYTAGFYGAFVYDLEGYKIEAVVREALPKGS
jgi:catechol 2,3-dioxygenase-like lactoylglutathione lyase family enzyme